jgi:hypothetical protein
LTDSQSIFTFSFFFFFVKDFFAQAKKKGMIVLLSLVLLLLERGSGFNLNRNEQEQLRAHSYCCHNHVCSRCLPPVASLNVVEPDPNVLLYAPECPLFPALGSGCAEERAGHTFLKANDPWMFGVLLFWPDLSGPGNFLTFTSFPNIRGIPFQTSLVLWQTSMGNSTIENQEYQIFGPTSSLKKAINRFLGSREPAWPTVEIFSPILSLNFLTGATAPVSVDKTGAVAPVLEEST